MTIINNAQNFNPNALNVPGLYTVVKRPPGYIQGVPTSVGFVVGTGSWGPMNTPILCGSPNDFAYKFNPVGPAALTDPFDLATEIAIAFQQTEADSNGAQYWAVRIGDGTEVAAYASLMDTTGTPKAGIKLTALYPGIRGNSIQAKVSAGSKTNTYHVDIIAPAGLDSERFQNIPGGSAGVFWTNLLNAINLGQNGQRGPSVLVKASNVDATAIAPALASVTLASGTDGRSGVDGADFVGSSTADPPTGIYTIIGLDPFPSTFWLAGITDNTIYTSLQALVDSVGTFGGLAFPAGTDVATAVSTKKTLGIDTPNMAYAKDQVYWYDSANGVQRLVSPLPFIMGRITALAPEESPLNKNVFGVVGTERLNDRTGFRKYAPSDIGLLQENGIMVIHNPIPAGPSWGLPHGSNSSTDLVRHVIEYARMTNWLAHSFESYMGKYVGELQSDVPDDPLRAAVKLSLDDFLQSLKTQRQIQAFKVVCDLTNNSPMDIAKHYMYADVFVRYMSSVQYFIINLQGGTTVLVERSYLDEAQAAQIGI